MREKVEIERGKFDIWSLSTVGFLTTGGITAPDSIETRKPNKQKTSRGVSDRGRFYAE